MHEQTEARAGVEYGRRGRRDNSFPAEWGTPPGRPGSEERAGWIAENVRRTNPATARDPKLAQRVILGKMEQLVNDYRKLRHKQRRR